MPSSERVASRYQAFLFLRTAFTVAPILFGVDKFFNFMVDWPDYLAPRINDIVPLMYVVGAVEIAAGLLVGLAPSLGGPGASTRRRTR